MKLTLQQSKCNWKKLFSVSENFSVQVKTNYNFNARLNPIEWTENRNKWYGIGNCFSFSENFSVQINTNYIKNWNRDWYENPINKLKRD
jgi:hypothetical protein